MNIKDFLNICSECKVCKSNEYGYDVQFYIYRKKYLNKEFRLKLSYGTLFNNISLYYSHKILKNILLCEYDIESSKIINYKNFKKRFKSKYKVYIDCICSGCRSIICYFANIEENLDIIPKSKSIELIDKNSDIYININYIDSTTFLVVSGDEDEFELNFNKVKFNNNSEKEILEQIKTLMLFN